MIFSFLLALPFTSKFRHWGRPAWALPGNAAARRHRDGAAGGPVAYHRLVFRRHLKRHLVGAANVMAILGLATVGLTVSAAVLLVVSYVAGGAPAAIIGVFVVCLFAGLWFVYPLTRHWDSQRNRRNRPARRPDQPGAA